MHVSQDFLVKISVKVHFHYIIVFIINFIIQETQFYRQNFPSMNSSVVEP